MAAHRVARPGGFGSRVFIYFGFYFGFYFWFYFGRSAVRDGGGSRGPRHSPGCASPWPRRAQVQGVMSEHTFAAMGTTFWLRADGLPPDALRDAEQQVRDIEARLSRFLQDSALSQLNRLRVCTDAMLADVARAALRARDLTGGAFDATVGDAVIAAGYDRSFSLLEEPILRRARAEGPGVEWPGVEVEHDTVRLFGAGRLDLGGIAKGWTVDRVGEHLAALDAVGWVVDGGGDIRVGGRAPDGEWRIGIGDDHVVGLLAGAVATSSRRERRWQTVDGPSHHIIDPRTGQPCCGCVDAAAVLAPDAATADVLATALIADFDATWPALVALRAAAFVHTEAEGWRMSPNMKEHLRCTF